MFIWKWENVSMVALRKTPVNFHEMGTNIHPFEIKGTHLRDYMISTGKMPAAVKQKKPLK